MYLLIFSAFLYEKTNSIIDKIPTRIIITKPIPSKGIMVPDINIKVAKIEIGLVINWIKTKVKLLILVIPASEHKASSGKNGSKNIKKSKTLSFPFNFSKYSSTWSFPPNAQLTYFLPIVLPKMKAKIEPKNIPINEKIRLSKNPNT